MAKVNVCTDCGTFSESLIPFCFNCGGKNFRPMTEDEKTREKTIAFLSVIDPRNVIDKSNVTEARGCMIFN